jgi:hypothetical protein
MKKIFFKSIMQFNKLCDTKCNNFEIKLQTGAKKGDD